MRIRRRAYCYTIIRIGRTATGMRGDNTYLRLAIVRRSAAHDVEQRSRQYNIATMSNVNCGVSNEILQNHVSYSPLTERCRIHAYVL